ncbi:hypothetical protein NPA31_014675 [Aurantimonas sp. MSK8Z-1]|uniref:hypothetical protein n=1 Tax=Mangrovibrevibacter kandeliae TaxID=2968473 RepID=UPI0021190B5E|nr:hypothetical protein [Aurantimonas sp. MSK8Z-1]MCW4116207.1 hypothetical protein [Aurantimonas sp. MSK8Z-1]
MILLLRQDRILLEANSSRRALSIALPRRALENAGLCWQMEPLPLFRGESTADGAQIGRKP